jgi:hypothetical protein
MVALEVLLDVTCCSCGGSMAATVRCEGDGLMDGPDEKALACLACPHCRGANHVIFVPESGEVIDVLDRLRVVRMPEPSLN